MMKHIAGAVAVAYGCLAAVGALQAADLSKQEPIQVVVQLGTESDDLVFLPHTLTFQTGKLYKLVLKNPSNTKHCLSAPRFAAAVWTRKVETEKAEVMGAIREIELKPGGQAEWFFVPVQAGTFGLACTIAGHVNAGMVGEINVF